MEEKLEGLFAVVKPITPKDYADTKSFQSYSDDCIYDDEYLRVSIEQLKEGKIVWYDPCGKENEDAT